MLDHVSLVVSDPVRARAFYERALAPLGYAVLIDYGALVGFGADNKPDFWIAPGKRTEPAVHVCFAAKDRGTVDAFHAAALAAGGTDNGAPGLRPHYHRHYYGAFVRDPDGHNIEAVSHRAE
jgi:catechol 2,3-dioxygenase-like lactoylglutathione lyase family enzyme